MRLVSYLHDGRPGWGAVEDDRIAPLDAHWPDLRTAIEAGIDRIAARAGPATGTIPLDAVTLRPPVPNPEKILAIGVNYRSHGAETGREIGAHPAVFVRFPDAQVGSGQPVDQFDGAVVADQQVVGEFADGHLSTGALPPDRQDRLMLLGG